MTTPWEEYKKKLGDSRPWDMFNPNADRVDEPIAKTRLEICLGCDKLIRATKQCSECLCFMQQKTKLASAECPLHKW